MLAIFQQLGPTEIILILLVVVILFGAKKLPELARALGRSSKEFKKGLEEGATEPAEDSEAPAPGDKNDGKSG